MEVIERRVILLGHSLVVSLPQSWCKRNGIVKGSNVCIYDNKGHVGIYPQSSIESKQNSVNAVYTEKVDEESTPKKQHEINEINIEALVRERLIAYR